MPRLQSRPKTDKTTPKAKDKAKPSEKTLTDTDTPQLPATTGATGLAAYGGYERPAEVDVTQDAPESTKFEPWKFLRFYSKKANNAIDVVVSGAIGKNPVEGHPYVTWSTKKPTGKKDSEGNEVYEVEHHFEDVMTTPFVVLKEMPHWVTKPKGGTSGPDRCWLTAQPFKCSVGDQKVQRGYEAVVLFFPEDGSVPYAACATVRGTKSDFVKDFLRAVDMTTDPGAYKRIDKKSGDVTNAAKDLIADLGDRMSRFPPRFRVTGKFNIVPKSGSGFAYGIARGVIDGIDEDCAAQLTDWDASTEALEYTASIMQLHEEKCEEMRALAEKTTDTPVEG